MSDTTSGAPVPVSPEVSAEEWIHATNAASFSHGHSIFGWRDTRSETGWCSGVIVEVDVRNLRVKVKDIRAGILK